MHKLLNATAVKTNERDNALLNKLDKLGLSIATAISTKIRTVQANIEDLQTMNSSYVLSAQELLRRISAAQNTTVQPAVDATTSTSANDSRFNPRTPPSLSPVSPPLPKKDENPDGSEPPKGPDMLTTPVGQSNFCHPYYGRSPRPSQSTFSIPPQQTPGESLGGSSPRGNGGGGGGGPGCPDGGRPGDNTQGGRSAISLLFSI